MPVCSEQLYEIVYRDGLEVVRYAGKYKIEVGLVCHNETNIRVFEVLVGEATRYQLSSCAKLQGYYICAFEDGYRIVKPSFVFVHVYSSKDRQWRVFPWSSAFKANSSFAIAGDSLFYVSEKTVEKINISTCQQEQEYEMQGQQFFANSATTIVGNTLVNFGGHEGQCTSRCMHICDLETSEQHMYKLNDISCMQFPQLLAVSEAEFVLCDHKNIVHIRKCEQCI